MARAAEVDDMASTVAPSLAGRPARPTRIRQPTTSLRLENLRGRDWDDDAKADERSVAGGQGLLLNSSVTRRRQPGVPYRRQEAPPRSGAFGEGSPQERGQLAPEEEDDLYDQVGDSATMSTVGGGSVITLAGPAAFRRDSERLLNKKSIVYHDFGYVRRGPGGDDRL